jgi:glycosyltransferase involved in cell wall biosynthesis
MVSLQPVPPIGRMIVHVAAKYPPALGGMEQVVQSLARTQYELGTQVKVFTSDGGEKELPHADASFPVSRLKSINIAHTPIMPTLLPRLLCLGRGSIIHLHISAAYTPEMVWIYSRLTRRPYLAHVHLDVPPSGRAGLLLRPYKRLLLRRVLRSASAVLVPTDDYRQLISHKYGIPQGRVTVIQNGTDHRITELHKSRCGKQGRIQVLFVGRLSVQKNIPLMLDAIAVYMRKYDEDLRLTIVGEGELRRSIQSRINRLGLGSVVTLRGQIFGEALQSAYQDSDLFLLTSMSESFGLVFVEAMAKGLPIVSVNILAVRNVVVNGVNGLLAEPNPDAVADAMHILLVDHKLYSTVSKNNLLKAREYAWKPTAEALATVYESASRRVI